MLPSLNVKTCWSKNTLRGRTENLTQNGEPQRYSWERRRRKRRRRRRRRRRRNVSRIKSESKTRLTYSPKTIPTDTPPPSQIPTYTHKKQASKKQTKNHNKQTNIYQPTPPPPTPPPPSRPDFLLFIVELFYQQTSAWCLR